MNSNVELPELPLSAWNKSKMTLHLILQIIGKTRLKMAPRKNHWWFITEYVSTKGFTTSTIPCHDGNNSFEITYNVHKAQVEIDTSFGEERRISLYNGLSVGEFYERYIQSLEDLKIYPRLYDRPFDLGITARFSDITQFHHFDQEYVKRFWRIMLWVNGVFNEFSGRFYGKTCPVQLYWHHMDLALTRFSGKKGPEIDPSARLSDKDAYSHECISFGFWAGDNTVTEPAFYSYTYPSPEKIENYKLSPSLAKWIDSNGTPMAFYTYADLLKEKDPKQALLAFLESAYQAGASIAKWDIEGFMTPALNDL